MEKQTVSRQFVERVKAQHESEIARLSALVEDQQVSEIKNYLDEGDLDAASKLLKEFLTREEKIEELREQIAMADEALAV